MYYKMKTEFLTRSLSQALDDDDDDELNFSQMSQVAKSSISELLDPRNSLPKIYEDPSAAVHERSGNNSREFEATELLTINNTAWSEKLNKPKPREHIESASPVFKRKMSLNFEPLSKALRNPKKTLSKFKSTLNFSTNMPGENTASDSLPDLETILTTKSRSYQNIDIKIPSATTSANIIPSIDFGWLDRNTSSINGNGTVSQPTSKAAPASSFGLSNLSVASSSLNLETIVDSNSLTVSDHVGDSDEIVGNSDDEDVPDHSLLPVAKKRRVSEEASLDKFGAAKKLLQNTTKEDQSPQEILESEESKAECDIDSKEDLDPKELPHSSMERQRSMITRSKERISQITRKTMKLFQGSHSKPTLANEAETSDLEKEEELNFLNDSDIKNFKTVPRASVKDMMTTERIFDDYMQQHDPQSSVTKTTEFVDSASASKREALVKKVKAGTLNENYVRVNLKKKIFVRGKKAFSFSKYKKGVWKSKKVAALSGPEMDMRGCDGGSLKCFNCDGIGHFAQNCKKKGDNLLPADAAVEDESPFLTLEEAMQSANDKKDVVHTNKPNSIATKPNEIWKEINKSPVEAVDVEGTDKENNDGNSETAGSSNSKQPVNVSCEGRLIQILTIYSFRLS